MGGEWPTLSLREAQITLKDHAERLWNDALSGRVPEEITLGSRRLQDEILESRRKSPPVFDWMFKRLRPRYEGQMIFGVDELVTQAKQRGMQKST